MQIVSQAHWADVTGRCEPSVVPVLTLSAMFLDLAPFLLCRPASLAAQARQFAAVRSSAIMFKSLFRQCQVFTFDMTTLRADT